MFFLLKKLLAILFCWLKLLLHYAPNSFSDVKVFLIDIISFKGAPYSFVYLIPYQIICITVEEEGDIEKFKDYKTSAKPAETTAPSEPSSPKQEVPEPAKAPEPKPTVSKTEEVPHGDDRIFSSPLARKLAEENNVSR